MSAGDHQESTYSGTFDEDHRFFRMGATVARKKVLGRIIPYNIHRERMIKIERTIWC
jgi:hypothetical protein